MEGDKVIRWLGEWAGKGGGQDRGSDVVEKQKNRIRLG